MKKILFVIPVLSVLLLAAFNTPQADSSKVQPPAAGKWTVDKAHSNVKFAISHLVVSELEGYFKIFDGTLEAANTDLSDAIINFTVDVNSINTENENRDKHLRSDDFFNAEKFPQMKFTSTSFKPAGGNKYMLAGNLTIRDKTLPVTFDVTYGGQVSMGGRTKAGFKAKTTINRFDYDLKWNRATEAGGLVVGKDVEITVNLEMNKQ
ncbi:MAG TPA: YceI family protein [Chitinophagaceae bacterium]|nr:YceI family protein [Chitinophagaceae bacterium]